MVSFLKTGISNNLNGSENGYLWNECDKREGGEENANEYIIRRRTPMRTCHKNSEDEEENDSEDFYTTSRGG